MCNYIYKELSCQHHYHLVESWCLKYIETERRCPPNIVSKQYCRNKIIPNNKSRNTDALPAACRERQQPSKHPWARLIQRPGRRISDAP
ncbi:hypothetical protein BKA56DRAFT_646955 [Ilyonectria sp. MPI-CAGE-AT-0026]|nr:hypothetical protein BKA56DRAFT_646955 [Ilyonectria sp. MPI-CAGE-AT-0026]